MLDKNNYNFLNKKLGIYLYILLIFLVILFGYYILYGCMFYNGGCELCEMFEKVIENLFK